MHPEHETFALPADFEVRQRDDSTEVEIEGYGIRWGSVADVGYGFTEEVKQGAFAETLRKHDQVLYIEHEGPAIARRSRNTMDLREDSTGLKLTATLDTDDQDSRSVVTKIRRGDIQAMSIGFTMYGDNSKQEWTEDEQGKEHRTIIQVAELFEVSLVSRPVFEDATVALRFRDEWRKAHSHDDIRNRIGKRLIETRF